MKPSIFIGGNFEELIKKSTIFVDKSLFIREVLEDNAKVVLITMPRRWGKSLNLDMLRRFLAIQTNHEGQIIAPSETESYRLFAGGEVKVGLNKLTQLGKLKIADEPCFAEECQQHPVIYLNLKDCKANTYEEVAKFLRGALVAMLEKHAYLKYSDQVYGRATVKEKYLEILQSANDTSAFTLALKQLSGLLYAHYGLKVWVLIDEYDAAANLAYREFDDGEAAKVASLFRAVFEPAFKDNEFLEKAVLTGVQYIVKSGMLSGLNNLAKYSIQSYKYAPYYGVNQTEMQLLLDHFDVPQDKRIRIKEWYNGYLEPTVDPDRYVEKYNIWSVANYLCNQPEGFKSYWEKSGSIDFLRSLFVKTEVKEQIINLLNEQTIYFKLKTDFSIDDFKALKEITALGNNTTVTPMGIDVLFSYLFICGYLTIDHTGRARFPNKEIRYEMGERISEYYQTIYTLDTRNLRELTDVLQVIFDKTHSLEASERVEFVKQKLYVDFKMRLSQLIGACRFVRDADAAEGIFANEDSVHSILNYIGLQVVNTYFGSEVYTNKLAGGGSKVRTDFVIRNKSTGLIMEIKYQGSVNQALEQAKGYGELIKDRATQIFVGLTIAENKEVDIIAEVQLKTA